MLKQRDAWYIMKPDLFVSEIKCYFNEEVRHVYVVYRKYETNIMALERKVRLMSLNLL